MGEPSSDNPDTREVLWVSPEHPAVAIRYERPNRESGWRISGLIACSPTGSLGSAWMKRFPWRKLQYPYNVGGIIWDGEPTLETLEEAYDENENLIRNTTDLSRPRYRSQIDPVTDGRVYQHLSIGEGMDMRREWDELRRRLHENGADEATVAAAKKEYFYRMVAFIYTEASSGSGKPVEAVADRFNAPRTSAANWIREARVRGYLPPTTKGRAT